MENYLLFILTAMLIIMMPGPGFALVTKNTISHGKKWWDKDSFRNDIWNDDSYNNGYVRTLCYSNEICYVIYIL